MRRRWMTRSLATAVAIVAFGAMSGAAPAAASGDFTLVFSGQTSLTIEYGEAFFFELKGDMVGPCGCTSKITLYDGTSNKVLGTMENSDDETPFVIPIYSQVFNLAPMDAGKHSFTAQFDQGGGTALGGQTAKTDVPAQLTVNPAKLSTSLTVTADPSNADNVIMSASLSGRFVQELDYFQDPVSAPMPAGTWTFTGTNDVGKVVYESKLVQDAGIQSTASKYWIAPRAGSEYVVEAAFVPDAADAKNFTISNPENVSFTVDAPDEQAAPEAPSPSDDIDQAEGGPTGPSVPAFAVWLYSIVLLALIAATVFLIVRSRRSTAAQPGVPA